MKKTQIILGLIAGLMVLFSCVPPDPAAVYGPNWNNNGSSGNGITGPRILHKIQANNLIFTEYTSVAGVLNKVDFYTYDGTVQTEHDVVTLNYTNNKVSYFELSGNQVGNPTTLNYKIYPTYDGTGKIVSYVNEKFVGTALSSKSMGVITYNSNNQPITIIEKLYNLSDPFNPNSTYIWTGGQIESLLEYSGENIIKVTYHQKTFDPSDNSLLGTQTMIDEHSQYDSKISPYSTLSKDYRLLFGTLHPSLLYQLSYNNPLKFKITYPMAPVIEGNFSYQYDSQNYAVSELGGNEYIYKAIQ